MILDRQEGEAKLPLLSLADVAKELEGLEIDDVSQVIQTMSMIGRVLVLPGLGQDGGEIEGERGGG